MICSFTKRAQRAGVLIWLLSLLALLLSACGAGETVANASAPTVFTSAKLGTVDRNITYCTRDGVDLAMDVYYPRVMERPAPAVVYVHGGGWRLGDKEKGSGIPDIPALVARGYLVAAVDYRLAPEYKFPAQIQDVKCAIRSLRAHAAAYNLDPERIGAWGGSAGGHLVALLAVSDGSSGWDVGQYLDQSSRIQAAVVLFGPADLTTNMSFLQERIINQAFGTTDRSSPVLKRASPVTYISKDDPPFLILQGTDDKIVPPAQAHILYTKLEATGVPAQLVFVQHAGHGFQEEGGQIKPTRPEITKIIADFFDQRLK